MPSQHLLIRPASIKACVSTTAPFSKDSKEPTLIAIISFREDVVETSFRYTSLQRHLAAFKTWANTCA